ncbi:hypothetical protein [Actinacidiphila yeochonensis]|uniref:hypothetical protein n=1 Tax=Actinacidiphila yeochonensis TaxID=89050 RepID=UPI00068E563E|nr:hypothetical protein [Actinacidiphila yeochonensis]
MAPRERKPALAALAVLLILVGALGATVMVMRAGNKVSVVQIGKEVAAGDRIPSSALREVEVSDDSGVSFIRWNQRGDLTSHYRAATNLTVGSVLVVSMITDQDNSVPAGKSLVGISLKAGQYPDGLRAGQTVAAYLVGDEGKDSSDSSGSAGPSGNLISSHLTIRSAGSTGGSIGDSGDFDVTVVADDADAGALTNAAAAQNVALVLVPSKS